MKLLIRQWALVVVALLVAAPAPAQEAAAPESEAEAPLEREADADPGVDEEQVEDADPGVDEDQAEVEQSDDIEEIIVEGTTSATSLEVPTSVTTFSGSDVEQLRIQNISDLSNFTPNLEINTAFAASNPTLFIRGIGLKDYNANSASAVAVYQDGIAINSPAGQLFQMFDVEEVEVRRGPQGSLYGRNATAGAILVNSVKPDGEWGSNGSFTYGNYNNIEVEGALSFPIIEDVLSARTAFTYRRRDGITKNKCAGWDPVAAGYVDEDVTAGGNAGAVRNYVVTADALREEYEKDKASGYLADGRPFYTINSSNRGRRQRSLNEAGIDATANLLTLDQVCLIQEPGRIVTEYGEAEGYGIEGELNRDQHYWTPALEDFGGLEPHTNDLHNWAVRGILRAEPITGMDLIFKGHWGQNRSDSFHMQMIGASAQRSADSGDEDAVITDQIYRRDGNSSPSGTWDEVRAGEEGVPQEGLRTLYDGAVDGGLVGADPFTGYYNRDGMEKLDVLGFGLTARQEFDASGWWVPSLLTSITGYEQNERLVEVDGDGSPFPVMQADYGDETWQVSQELRIEGEGERLWWVFGGYFLYEELDSQNYFPGQLDRIVTQNFSQQLTHAAPFVHARYDFSDHLIGEGVPDPLTAWSLEGGVRYNWEHKDFTLDSTLETLAGINPLLLSGEEEGTWTGVTGDVTLSWSPLEAMTIYGKYSRGMKAGHFNAGLTQEKGLCPGDDPCQSIGPVEPEFIDAVEVGTKQSWFGGALQIQAAWFRYWYQDLQVFDIVNDYGTPPIQQLLNSDADVMGAELEIQARPFFALSFPWDGIFLQMGAGWNDAEFVDFVVEKAAANPVRRQLGDLDTFSYSGNPTIAAPRWNVSALIDWEIPISRFGSIVPQYNFSWRSRVALDPSNDELISQGAYWLHNARLAYRTPSGRIEVAGWVHNFTDTHYLVDVFDLTRQYSTILQAWGEPRTYGATISYMW